MDFQQFVTQRLALLTTAQNSFIQNAKNIDDLPKQNVLDPSSKIHVSRGKISESLEVKKIIDAVKSGTEDKLLSIGQITLVGNIISIPADAEWRISSIYYKNITSVQIIIPYCGTGLARKDILVVNTSNNFVLVKGTETAGITFLPNVPINTVFVTEIDVTDTNILGITQPDLSKYATVNYVKTQLDTKISLTDKGVVNGVGTLDGNGKAPLSQMNDALLGNVKYKGIYNGVVILSSPDVALNGTALPVPSSTNTGWYFIASVPFTNSGKDYANGDWIISNGVVWDRVDNTDAVSTVFGRVGHVTAQNGDYTTALVTETLNKRYVTDANLVTIGNQSGVNTGDETTVSLQTKRPIKTLNSISLEGVGNTTITTDDIPNNSLVAGVNTSDALNALNAKLPLISDYNKSYIAPSTSGMPRKSEGDVIVLTNGRYLSAYTAFWNNGTDFDPSYIGARVSADNTGRKWGNETIISNNIGSQNVISVSLLRINSTTLHCYFLVRNSLTSLTTYKSISTNEGATWATATQIINDGYGITLNASVKRGNSNRILIPVTYTPDGAVPTPVWSLANYYSDNDGTSYNKSNVVTFASLQGETSVVYLGGTNVLFTSRSTTTGYQWFTLSTNNGQTLGVPYQSTLQSSASPAQIVNYSGTLIALHNPNLVGNIRNPLTISKSLDSGATWVKIADLENYTVNTSLRASYPSMTIDGTNLLVSYFEDNQSTGISHKFAKINIPDLLNGIIPYNITPNNLYLKSLDLTDNTVVQPTNNVTQAISKLQSQINAFNGKRFEYTGIGQGIILKNNSPDNIISNVFVEYVNSDNTAVSRIGHLSTLQDLYVFTTKNLRLQAPNVLVPSGVLVVGNVASNGVDKLQVLGKASFTGTATAAPATVDTELATWGQAKAVARPYKVYTALLTQTGTNAPTAIVLENTLGGTVTWTRTSAGIYIGTCTASVFTINKVFSFSGNTFYGGGDNSIVQTIQQTHTTIGVNTIRISTNAPADGALFGQSIEFRVYN